MSMHVPDAPTAPTAPPARPGLVRTLLAGLLALRRPAWHGCSGSCSQGRGACDCRAATWPDDGSGDTLPSGPMPFDALAERARRAAGGPGRDALFSVAFVGLLAFWAVQS